MPQIERWKDQQYLKLHPEIDRKQYYKEKNKIKFNAEYRKKYYENNLEKKKALSIKAKAWRKRYKEEHFIEYCARRRRYIKNRITNDIDYRIKKNMRMRITQSVNGTKLYKHSIDLLGCSIEEVRNHIESQFKKGMTWDNWGVFGWHIDHIIPISSFDFTKKEDQYRCWHYTNLQPLWWKENVMKADNIIERQLILM
ncbi:MAG TPA: hypothetical protein VMV32_11935 [Ignavibacteriaceae bacterium]|nr:hypothetical protein [Ignavibacteriaceae bacterium]